MEKQKFGALSHCRPKAREEKRGARRESRSGSTLCKNDKSGILPTEAQKNEEARPYHGDQKPKGHFALASLLSEEKKFVELRNMGPLTMIFGLKLFWLLSFGFSGLCPKFPHHRNRKPHVTEKSGNRDFTRLIGSSVLEGASSASCCAVLMELES